METRIEALEHEQAHLLGSQGAPDFHKQTAADIATAQARLETVTRDIETLLERWAELEEAAV